MEVAGGELFKALAAAQAQMRAARFDSTNPHFQSRFASLASVIDVVRIAANHGIGFTQDIEQDERGIRCVTKMLHESGQMLESVSPWIKPSKPDAQGIVAATTYARRVGLSAGFCIAGDQDKDGNDVVTQGDPGPFDEGPPPDAPPPIMRPTAPPELINLAREAAERGIDAYQDFFTLLSKPERQSLLPMHEAFKEQARAADPQD